MSHPFTNEVPAWRPRLTPVDLAAASEAQRDALKVTPSNTKISDYLLVLAHDPETLRERSPLFNAVMYDRGGLSRSERELGAIGASIVNRCVYCAAVHAARFEQLTKDKDVVPRVFARGAEADLDPRQAAILRFAVKLSRCPPEADAGGVDDLIAAGLDSDEILDLILAASLFAWANRLMHTLGDPVPVGKAP